MGSSRNRGEVKRGDLETRKEGYLNKGEVTLACFTGFADTYGLLYMSRRLLGMRYRRGKGKIKRIMLRKGGVSIVNDKNRS